MDNLRTPVELVSSPENDAEMDLRQLYVDAQTKDFEQWSANFRAVLADRDTQATGGFTLGADRTGRVYLSGPMTGLPEHNFPAFNMAAAELRAQGCEVFNPAETGLIDGAQWEDYLRFDINKLGDCEIIALMPGWSRSKGARLELHVASELGMPVRLLEGAEPIDSVSHNLSLAPYPAPSADLLARCTEILGWIKTGRLQGDALKAYADLYFGGEEDSIHMAERRTRIDAMQYVLGQARPAIEEAPPASEGDKNQIERERVRA